LSESAEWRYERTRSKRDYKFAACIQFAPGESVRPLCQIDLRMAELGFQVIGEQEVSIIRRTEM
jgi:hypothetical protein